MRAVLLVALVALGPELLAAQEPREIVRRAIELDRRNYELAPTYKTQHRQEDQLLDEQGNSKSRTVRAWEVTYIEGSPYRRLVARDDKPIASDEQQWEEQKLRQTIEDRRKETTEQRTRRIADWQRSQQKRREPLAEMPDAFDFKLTGSETVRGREAWVIDSTPKPGYRPKRPSAAVFQKVKVRVWVDKRESQWSKFELETLDTVPFGGLVFRVAKGSRLVMEQVRVDDQVWQPTLIDLKMAGRLLLVKAYRRRYILSYWDYRKIPSPRRVE